MNKWNKLLLGLMVAMVMILPSCEVWRSMTEDRVLTTYSNVKEEFKETAVPFDLNLLKNILPKDVAERFKDAGNELVFVDKDSVKESDPEKVIDVSDPESSIEGIIGVGLSLAKTAWPGVAALEVIWLLFSTRKRKHYTDAIKKAAPFNGKVELLDAVMSLGRGLGLAHSSKDSKAAFEEGDLKNAKSA